ncbi:hypothetical protein ACQBAR_02490 [Propionibacteriaceae bacterium Y1685]
MINDDEGFPREVQLAEGECAEGKLVFPSLPQATPATTAIVFENDYGQREEYLIG